MKTTTLNEIKAETPCSTGWEKLLQNLNKIKADDEVLTFKQILESNGIKDAVWALRVLDFKDQALLRADLAESVLHIFEERYPEDKRPRLAIEAIRDYHAGIISKEDLDKAADVAYDALGDAYDALGAINATDFAAYAVADAATTYVTTYAATTYADAWKNTEQLFIKHFC